jgi:hypothetical protein
MTYDSTADTQAHIARVQALLEAVVNNLTARAAHHDESKLAEPEKSAFDRCTPALKTAKYGTPEYDEATAQLGDALRHHYAHNSHHPEHYPNRIAGMSLLDIAEMFCDWKAASERESDVFAQTLPNRCGRNGIDLQLAAIFKNTRKELGW